MRRVVLSDDPSMVDGSLGVVRRVVLLSSTVTGPPGPRGLPGPSGDASSVQAALDAHIASSNPHPDATSGLDLTTFYLAART